ncbi:MAG: hypothetical protein HN368_23570 [Spirochaetales bacterium]|jgi:hypothetical protein|nr:hypothetical protein [Spirochaetales bacterium]
MNSRLHALFSTLIILLSPCVAADSPNLTLSVGPSAFISGLADDSASPASGYLNTGIFLGAYDPFNTGSYSSFSAQVDFNLSDSLSFHDREYLHLDIELNKISLDVGILSSLIRSETESIFINPDWKVKADISAAGSSSLYEVGYSGFLLYLPDISENIFYESLRFMSRFDPSIFFGFSLSTGAGWENHYETPLYDQTGTPTGKMRHDLILDAGADFDGMIGYFSEWAVGGKFAWQQSNASLYISPSFYLDRSEDRITADINGSFFSSPHQSVTIEGSVFSDNTWYLYRTARDSEGAYSPERLYISDVGASARIDWTPNQEFFIVFSGNGSYIFSNDSFVGGWNLGARLLFELSF